MNPKKKKKNRQIIFPLLEQQFLLYSSIFKINSTICLHSITITIHDNYCTCNVRNLPGKQIGRINDGRDEKRTRFTENGWKIDTSSRFIDFSLFASPIAPLFFALSLAALRYYVFNFAVQVISLKGQCDFRTDGRRATFTYTLPSPPLPSFRVHVGRILSISILKL